MLKYQKKAKIPFSSDDEFGNQMAIYVDSRSWTWQGQEWGHLIGDSLEELHDFAARLGLQQDWFQETAKFPHYDITLRMKSIAVAAGAVQLQSRDFIYKARLIGRQEINKSRQLQLDL